MALDKGASTANAAGGLSSLLDFISKSEALQRILGLGPGSLFSSLPSARRYSMTAPSLFGHNPANPPGLGNLNNSCYQNSIIQGLASLRSLSGFLDHNIETLGNRHAFATHLALKDIVERLNDSSNGGRQLWIPRDLKSMSTWQQQDAQEYFSKVVDQLDKEIRVGSRGLNRDAGLKVAQSQDEQSGLTLKFLSKDDTGKEFLEKFRSNGYGPPFVNPLEGLLAQRVGCMQCGWTEGLTLFQFNCVTVPLRRGYEFDIRQCLSDYTELELIEGVECPKCTLLRAQTQLQQMLERLEAESDSEGQASNRTLTDGLKAATERRLEAVGAALNDEDYSEKTLSGPCVIPRKNRVCSTKSKQAVIAKAPRSLTIHVNRSMFDEFSGLSLKNGANVRFPIVLDLDPWCLGTKSLKEDDAPETWVVDPSKSMLRQPGVTCEATNNRRYELRAVVTHSGHHENGHYICFRKYPKGSFPGKLSADDLKEDDDENFEHWFMLSDANVYPVSESTVLSQGGVFMLFYELMDEVSPSLETVSATVSAAQFPGSEVDPSEVNPLLDISNTPRKHAAITKQGQQCNDAGSPRATPTSEISDMSSSSSSEVSVYEETMRVGVPRIDLVMRTSSNSSTTRRGKSPNGKSPISPVMAN